MRAGPRPPAFLTLAAVVFALLAGGGSSGSTTETGGGTTGAAETGGGSETTPEPSARTSKSPAGVTVRSCRATRVEGTVRAVGVACSSAKTTVSDWLHSAACAAPAEASRGACSVGRFRCLATRTDRGLAIDCAQPGRSIAFTVATGESSGAPGGGEME